MGFENRYLIKAAYSDYSQEDANSKLPGRRSTILPFFGFQYKIETKSTTERTDNGYSLIDKGNDTYLIQKNRATYNTKYAAYAVFTRDKSPTGEYKRLEDKFYNTIYFRSMFIDQIFTHRFDVSKTPYLSRITTRKYYDLNKLYISERAKKLKKAISILTVLAFLGSLAGMCVIVELTQSALLGLLFLAASIGSIILGSVIKKMINKREFKKNAFDKLTNEQKRAIQQKHLSLYTIGIPEADKILREYAKLYDENFEDET